MTPAIVVVGEVAGLDLPVTAPTRGNVNAGRETTEELRPARESDAGELLVLQRACWMQEALDNDSMDIPALHEDLAAVLTDLAHWETWVLRRGPRLVGAVRGQRRGTDWEVGRLMVAPDQAARCSSTSAGPSTRNAGTGR